MTARACMRRAMLALSLRLSAPYTACKQIVNGLAAFELNQWKVHAMPSCSDTVEVGRVHPAARTLPRAPCLTGRT